MDSILQTDTEHCFLCGKNSKLERYQEMHWHHIFYGTANRAKSEKYGLKVRLCCYARHEYGPNAVHQNKAVDDELKKTGQRVFEEYYADRFKNCEYKGFTGARAKFVEEFGKNYL